MASWVKVLMAADCPECPGCGEPLCTKHKQHYACCPCVGPNEDGYEYKTIRGKLYARKEAAREE